MLLAYLTRGVKAGLLAGLMFGALVALVANPLVGYADGLGHGGGDHHDGGVDAQASDRSGSAVSTAVTRAVSTASGALWGVLLGATVFGVAFYLLEPGIPGAGATKSYLLAGAGFVTVSGAPWLALPPQPPGVERALGADARLLLYGGMMVLGALVCLSAGGVYNRLRTETGPARSAGVALLPFAVLAVPTALAPPTPAESALPADLATGLVGVVVFGQVLLWACLATAHAWFLGRSRDGAAESDAIRAEEGVFAD